MLLKFSETNRFFEGDDERIRFEKWPAEKVVYFLARLILESENQWLT